jgi:hypothetical protein
LAVPPAHGTDEGEEPMAKRAAFEHAGISRRNRSVADRLTAKRSGRLRWFALTLPALALALMAVPAASAGVRHDTAGSAGATYYAIGKPVCKQAKPGHATCFAMRRVEVKRGTPGARPFKLAGGASQNAARTGPDATIGPAGGLTPSDLATAYDFSSTATGTGQTVAIVDAYNDPDINADLQTFDTEYGLATCNETDGNPAFRRHHGLVRRGVARRRDGAFGVPALQDHPARGEQLLELESRYRCGRGGHAGCDRDQQLLR